MSKYQPLWLYVDNQFKSHNLSSFILGFEEIEHLLGFPIDHSFLNFKNELEEFNVQVSKISLKKKEVQFIRKG